MNKILVGAILFLVGCVAVKAEYRVSLPLVMSGPSIYGVEIAPNTAQTMLPFIKDTGYPLVRYNRGLWGNVAKDIELIPNAVLILRGPVPEWAREYSWVDCGHIKPENYKDFVQFAVDTSLRYRNVKYFELWNEPDAPYTAVSDGPFGCWGDPLDKWYGGKEYGQLLGMVYDAIKDVRPDAQIVFGGLMLDKPDSPRGLFLEGAILGGAKFDVMAFHRYNVYGREEDMSEYDDRLAFVREVLRHHNLYKNVWVNETALLCDDITSVCDEEFETAKAEFVTQLYEWGAVNDVERIFWYQLNPGGWRYSGLVGTPAYDVYKELTE